MPMKPSSPAVLLRSLLAAVAVAAPASALAMFENGGFESGDFTGWTLEGGTNPGLAGGEPFDGSSVLINPGSAGPSAVVGQITDPYAPTIVLPRLGSHTAQLNDAGGGALVTVLRQTDIVSTDDIDPADGLPHVRFAFAPVLEDPSHAPHEQPYFFVQVKDIDADVVLFEQFAYSGQAGVDFLQGVGNWKYLEFQDVDAVLPADAIGNRIELTVIAADCALGAHGGYVYVDGFGSSTLPPDNGAGGGQPREVRPVPTLGTTTTGLLALLVGFAGWWRSRRRTA